MIAVIVDDTDIPIAMAKFAPTIQLGGWALTQGAFTLKDGPIEVDVTIKATGVVK